jgi:hypothetical protein
VRRHRGKWIAVLACSLVGFGAVAPAADAQTQQLSATVGSSPGGYVMSPGFVGVSLEYSALHAYTGRNPAAVNPVLIRLLRGLAPAQAPVVRIGGNSEDESWWPIRGAVPPAGVNYTLTPSWVQTTKALAADLGAHLIMGLNMAGGRPSVAATEARVLFKAIGSKYISDFEIGNEPDVYNQFPWFVDRHGKTVYARPASWNVLSFVAQYSRFRAAIPPVPLAGPSFAELAWIAQLPAFLRAEHGLKLATVHRYPLRAGVTQTTSPIYASIPNLLGDTSSAGLAQGVAPAVQAASAAGLPFRLDEMNSASNRGQKGTSDTFASALWALDTFFNFANVGVDGVNVHTLPGAAYELFTFAKPHGTWQAFVHPEYYGMMMFAQAFPPGARFLPVSAPNAPLKVWADQAPDGHVRVELINKDTTNAYQVQVQVPNANVVGRASLEYLQAPAVNSTTGVTLGGQTFGAATTTGSLPPPQTQPALAVGSTYTVNVPAASAVLLTQ